jgi:hypothetical protein
MTKAPGEQVVGGNGGQASSFASLWQSCAALPPHLTFGKMKWKRLATATLGVLLSSCTFDRTDHPLVGQMVGKALTTKRATVLAWGRTGKGTPFELDWDSPMLELHDELEYEKYKELIGPPVLRLPAGTPLRVSAVKVFAGDSQTTITAFGVIGSSGVEHAFFYTLGYSGSLGEAPWEPPMRPSQRSFDIYYEQVEQVGAQNP